MTLNNSKILLESLWAFIGFTGNALKRNWLHYKDFQRVKRFTEKKYKNVASITGETLNESLVPLERIWRVIGFNNRDLHDYAVEKKFNDEQQRFFRIQDGALTLCLTLIPVTEKCDLSLTQKCNGLMLYSRIHLLGWEEIKTDSNYLESVTKKDTHSRHMIKQKSVWCLQSNIWLIAALHIWDSGRNFLLYNPVFLRCSVYSFL